MNKVDARTQTRAQLQARRELVVRLHQDGVQVMEIVQQTGLSWSAVNAAIKCFKAGGYAALAPAARGRKHGTGRKLTIDQEAEIRQLVRLRRPGFYGLGDALWSRDAVMLLIQKQLGISLTERGLGNYLGNWGLAEKWPRTRPAPRCTPDANYSAAGTNIGIHEKATRSNTKTYWMSKVRVLDPLLWSQNSAQHRAETEKEEAIAVVRSTETKIRLVSVVNGQGKLLWMIISTPFNSKQEAKLMNALSRDANRNEMKVYQAILKERFQNATKG